MAYREKPMIDAVSKVDPLPSFLFSNPFVAGFFAICMCAVFGAILALFYFFGGGDAAIGTFEVARGGAIFGLAIGAISLVATIVSALINPDERATQLLFVFGGVTAIAVFVSADILFLDAIRERLTAISPINPDAPLY